MESGSSLKDALFNLKRVTYLADLFCAVDSNFNKKKFVAEAVKKFPELELKARIVWITEVLERYLPSDASVAMTLIVLALPLPLDSTKSDDDFGEFILAPLGEYVVRNGLAKKYLKQSFMTLREITMRFSMEDAMRSFLNLFPDETLAHYDIWVNDSNYHVRRLVSESTRPLLPWSRRLTLDYHVPIAYLDMLYSDKTRYVTRSVANHLNDISKKDPVLVIATLERWRLEGKQTDTEITWIIKHALRTLIKQGNREALALIGFKTNVSVTVSDFTIATTQLRRGDMLTLSFTVSAPKPTKLLIDYVIDFVKANGQTKPKVFKLKQLTIEPRESYAVQKSHHLKADATTFTLYPGLHTISLQINGMVVATEHFQII